MKNIDIIVLYILSDIAIILVMFLNLNLHPVFQVLHGIIVAIIMYYSIKTIRSLLHSE